MWYMKSEVYSWRLSSELKSDLERAARLKKVSTSAIIEFAVRDWLQNAGANAGDADQQKALHARVAASLGVLAGRNARRAETARALIVQRLTKRRAR